MRQTTMLALIFAAVSPAFTPAFALDQQLLDLVMPDAKVMAGVNVTSAKNSTFGQYVLSHMPAADQGLQNLIATTGFDPRQDLTEILAAGAGQGSKSGLVLARGNFNVPQITAAAKNQQVQTYDGATLLTSTNPKDNGAVAFLNGSIAIAGDTASVKAALDRQTNPAPIDPAIATEAQTLSAANDAWSLTTTSPTALLPAAATANAPANQVTTLLANVQSASGGMKFNDQNVTVTGQAIADTPQNAGALGDVIRLIVTLVTTNAGANAQAAAAAQVLQSLQITTDGNAVNMSLNVPESQLEAFLNSTAALPGMHAGAAARHRGAASPSNN